MGAAWRCVVLLWMCGMMMVGCGVGYVSSPLSCSTSPLATCHAYLFLDNTTAPLGPTASLFHVSAASITAFNASDATYVASVPCSCQPILNTSAFFYALAYTWRPADVGSSVAAVCDARFHGLCFWRGDDTLDTAAGDDVQMAVGCGCPPPGYAHVISYRIQPGDALSVIAYDLFHTSQDAIVHLNNIANPDLIISNQVLFVPTNQTPPIATASPMPANVPPTDVITTVPPSAPSNAPHVRKEKGSGKLKYALSGALALAIVTGAFMGIFILKHMKKAPIHNKGCQHVHTSLVCDTCISEESISGELRLFSLRELKDATNNFSESCRLGRGGFGEVFKGVFPDGSLVAIKTRKVADTFSKKQFVNEINLLSKLHHSNLVHLLGACLEDGSVILVYEYIPNGNLAQHLAGKFLPQIHLNWPTRFKIVLQIAEALYYLHNACMQSTETVPGPVYHRDIKPANILLDEKLDAKVGDFGLSRLVIEESSNIFTNAVGTMGYGDPQYFQSEYLTDKSDVYSFGVILMELITAKKHLDSERDSEMIHIGPYSLCIMKQGKFEEIIDPKLKSDDGSWGNESVRRSIWSCAKLAWRCMRFERVSRPSMEMVLESLRRIKRRMELNQMDKSDSDSQQDREVTPLTMVTSIQLYPHSKCILSESEGSESEFESH